jgi:3D (Asp-Asp-Asp) domain-containing protein
MLRYIYCPDESMLDEATALSTEFVIPIMIGYAKIAEDVDFDRTKVGLILIPEQSVMFIPDHGLMVGQSFMAHYANDNISSNEIDLFVFYKDKETKIKTMIQDNRTVKFAILPKSEGLYKIIVKHKDKEIETHEFTVEKE